MFRSSFPPVAKSKLRLPVPIMCEFPMSMPLPPFRPSLMEILLIIDLFWLLFAWLFVWLFLKEDGMEFWWAMTFGFPPWALESIESKSYWPPGFLEFSFLWCLMACSLGPVFLSMSCFQSSQRRRVLIFSARSFDSRAAASGLWLSNDVFKKVSRFIKSYLSPTAPD